MDPLTAAALIQTGYYGVQSLIDKERSARYAKKSRPTYEIPVSATMARNRAIAGAGTYGYGGMGRDIARSEQAMANAMPALRNLSGSQQMNMLSALVKGTQQQQGAYADIAERAKERREQQAQQTLMAYAPYEQQQFSWDKQQPYLNAMQTAANFESQSRAGMQAAVSMFSNLVAGGGLGGKKPSSPAFRSGVDASGNPVSINPDMPAGYVPEGFSMMQAPPEPPPVPNFSERGLRQPPGTNFAEQGLRQPPIPMVDAANPNDKITPYIDPIRSFQMPWPVTKSFAETTLGIPLSNETFDYYNLDDTYNNAFNSLYRQKYSPY
jgi:hypothetical protein